MLISLKHKLAFLAVPKTGTTAIEAALLKHAQIVFRHDTKLKHTNAETFDTLLRPYLDKIGYPDIQSFAVMRDPIDHLQSWYFYRRRLDENKPQKHGRSTKDVTLEQFLEDFLTEPPPEHAVVGNQMKFLCGAARLRQAAGTALNPLVDIIFPYDRLHDALAFVGKRFGSEIAVERKNTSQREEVEIAPAMLARLEARLAPDIALYRRVQAGEFLPDSPHARARLKPAAKPKGQGAQAADKRRRRRNARAPEQPE